MTASDRSMNKKGSTEQLLVAIASGQTITAAAATAGMNERTARRRLEDPDVVERLTETRAATLTTAADMLTTLALAAATALGEIVTDRDVHPSVRVRAASALLSRAIEVREAAILYQRLDVLERLVKAQNSAWRRHAA